MKFTRDRRKNLGAPGNLSGASGNFSGSNVSPVRVFFIIPYCTRVKLSFLVLAVLALEVAATLGGCSGATSDPLRNSKLATLELPRDTAAPSENPPSRMVPAPDGNVALISSEPAELLALVNSYRAQQSLQPLALNVELTGAAQWQSDDMATRDLLSHTDSLGRDSFERMRQFHYSSDSSQGQYGTLGENIACGHPEAQATFEQWKNSPPHNANLLGVGYRDLGLGRARSANVDPYSCGWYWTADFGSID